MAYFDRPAVFNAAKASPGLIAGPCAGVAALAIALFGLLAERATASSYAYDFELSLVSEQVFATIETTPGRETTLGINTWLDPSDIGAADQSPGLGVARGARVAGQLHLTEPYDFGLTVGERTAFVEFAWVMEEDAGSGDVKLAFSTTATQYEFDFIDEVATYRHDYSGALFATDGSIFGYHGYRAEYALTQIGGGAPDQLASMPLPAGPLLLLTGIAGLTVFRRRQRQG